MADGQVKAMSIQERINSDMVVHRNIALEQASSKGLGYHSMCFVNRRLVSLHA